VELLRKGVAERVTTPLGELAAVVSDFDIDISRPVFHFDQINEIADFLEKEAKDPQKVSIPINRLNQEDEKP
jgi:hypothetical protein